MFRGRERQSPVKQVPAWISSFRFRRNSCMACYRSQLGFSSIILCARAKTIRVSQDGSGDFSSVQKAVDTAEPGAIIAIAPGTYREAVIISKPNLRLRGTGGDPRDTVIVFDKSAGSTGSTFRSATVEARGDGFHAENLTFAN